MRGPTIWDIMGKYGNIITGGYVWIFDGNVINDMICGKVKLQFTDRINVTKLWE